MAKVTIIKAPTKKVRVKSVPSAEQGTTMYALASNGLQVEGDQYEMLSPDTMMLKGNSHENGGTKVAYQGNMIEAEAGEPMSIDKKGEAIVWGNMKVPGTNQKFKQAAKELGEEEARTLKMANKATELVNTKNPYDRYEIFGFNSGRVMADAAKMKQKALGQAKEMLGDTQQSLLELSKLTGQEPKDIANNFAKGGKLPSFPKAADGATMAAENRQLIRQAARKYNIPEYIAQRLVGIESSGGRQGMVSNKGAKSFAQFMPETAKSMGLRVEQLSSNAMEDRAAVADASMRYLKQQVDANGGDLGLGLVAYNGGQEAVNFAKKTLGKKNITFADWNQVMADRRKNQPTSKKSAWQNQSYNYANNILGLSGEDFYGTDTKPSKAHQYHQEFYTPLTEREAPEVMQSLPVKMLPFENPIVTNPPAAKTLATAPDKPKFNTEKPKLPSIADQMKFDYGQITPELYSVFDRPDFVRGQQFDPTLYTPYNVSFQDKLNENNATFRQTAQQLSNNPAALATLAGQKYQQDNAVLSEQFRTNQGIENDVMNKNNQLLNQAKQMNLQLQDQQFTRQAQAKSNTEARRLAALQSISGKYATFKKEKFKNQMMEQFSDYRIDPETGDLKYMGADHQYVNGLGQYIQPTDAKVTTKVDDEGHKSVTTTTDPYAQAKQQKRTKSKWPNIFR